MRQWLPKEVVAVRLGTNIDSACVGARQEREEKGAKYKDKHTGRESDTHRHLYIKGRGGK